MTAHIPQPNKDLSSLTKNRIVAPIVLWIAIFIGILFTRPVYLTYIDSKANLMKLEGNLKELSAEYDSLLAIKNNTEADSTTSLLTKKILAKFDRANILSEVMFNDYTKEGFWNNPKIAIGGISVSDPTRLPNGLSFSNVSVSVQWNTVDEIVDYITYLTTETSYAFTLENISLPIDTSPEGDLPDGYGMGLTFGIYTYES